MTEIPAEHYARPWAADTRDPRESAEPWSPSMPGTTATPTCSASASTARPGT